MHGIFCNVFAHFVVKQALFGMAGGVFKFMRKKNQFLLLFYKALYGISLQEFPRLGLFNDFGKTYLDINPDIGAPCWVLLLVGILSVTVLNPFAREVHKLIFILRADGKNTRRHVFSFSFHFCFVYVRARVCRK